jgi:hypothetical protein
MADARANYLNTFAFGSKCSFLNSTDGHFDMREGDSFLGKPRQKLLAGESIRDALERSNTWQRGFRILPIVDVSDYTNNPGSVAGVLGMLVQ